MTTYGSLGDEIERKSAEIHSWPTWAQPFRPDSPPADTGTTHSTPGTEQPVTDETATDSVRLRSTQRAPATQ